MAVSVSLLNSFFKEDKNRGSAWSPLALMVKWLGYGAFTAMVRIQLPVREVRFCFKLVYPVPHQIIFNSYKIRWKDSLLCLVNKCCKLSEWLYWYISVNSHEHLLSFCFVPSVVLETWIKYEVTQRITIELINLLSGRVNSKRMSKVSRIWVKIWVFLRKSGKALQIKEVLGRKLKVLCQEIMDTHHCMEQVF